jgi:hypothetical protein
MEARGFPEPGKLSLEIGTAFASSFSRMSEHAWCGGQLSPESIPRAAQSMRKTRLTPEQHSETRVLVASIEGAASQQRLELR